MPCPTLLYPTLPYPTLNTTSQSPSPSHPILYTSSTPCKCTFECRTYISSTSTFAIFVHVLGRRCHSHGAVSWTPLQDQHRACLQHHSKRQQWPPGVRSHHEPQFAIFPTLWVYGLYICLLDISLVHVQLGHTRTTTTPSNPDGPEWRKCRGDEQHHKPTG